MTQLGHIEWVRINDIALIVHGTKSIQEMRRFLLEAIRILVPYSKAMFYLANTSGDDVILQSPVFVNVDTKFARAYEDSVQNAVFGRVAINTHRSIAYRDTDIMPEAVRINSDVYNSLLLPNDVPFGGGIILANDGHLVAELTLFRTKRQGDFTDKELHVLDILKAHLELRFGNRNSADSGKARIVDFKRRLYDRGLTTREIEIVEMIGQGVDTLGTSKKLGISIFTVKRHLHNVFGKLGVSKRTQLINLISDFHDR